MSSTASTGTTCSSSFQNLTQSLSNRLVHQDSIDNSISSLCSYRWTQNLLQDGESSASPMMSPQPPSVSQSSSPVACYPCDHQLQYQRIMSKPGSTTNNKNDNKEEHAGIPQSLSLYMIHNTSVFYRCVSLLLQCETAEV